MYSIGYDIGSSSVKGSILDLNSGTVLSSAQYPKSEMIITSPHPGWAEQPPEAWWSALKEVTAQLLDAFPAEKSLIKYIGIAYQMHGLVVVDSAGTALRPSIIWCDSRAIKTGEEIFNELGKEFCLSNYLNSPGNFTLSKLKWLKDNEPGLFSKIDKIMLPGDFIAMKLSNRINTTISGLSEGIMWNFRSGQIASKMLKQAGLSEELLPDIVGTFTNQAAVSKQFCDEFGLSTDIQISYRAGDQPNNAFSLNVLKPGEVAATAGTSGVVYGVSNTMAYDPLSRVNSFAHVNHQADDPRLGILLCINGCGITNSWVKKHIGQNDYIAMNTKAGTVPIGSEGLQILPFGNGAERMLENKNPGCTILGLDFNRHNEAHLYRAAQEAIAFSFAHGMEILNELGMNLQVIRAGNANMFQSSVFREALANASQSTIELYNTDGSTGAARGAGIGGGFYKNSNEAFQNLKIMGKAEPEKNKRQKYLDAYGSWKKKLDDSLKGNS